MNYLHAILLGIVEGITEFLPISSTGHLILAAKVLKLPDSEFLKSFEIAIQMGAILSVVVLYFRRVVGNMRLASKVLIAFVPTAVLGLLFYKIIKTYLLASTNVVTVSLLLGGIFLIVFEYFHREKESAVDDLSAITVKQAVAIGLFQSIAMIPGVSRAAATIVGGLLLGLKRKTIVEFSFLLAVPTMVAATGLDLIKSSSEFNSSDFGLLAVGFVVSFLVALITIKFLLNFIRNHTFTGFGVYRILVAIAFWILIRR